jgi:hypothetical protein
VEVINPLLPLAIVIGICIIQWLRAKRATRALEAKRALQAAEKKKRTAEAIQSHQASQALEADRYSRAIETKTKKTEHERAMQLVYDGLSNVMAHLLSPGLYQQMISQSQPISQSQLISQPQLNVLPQLTSQPAIANLQMSGFSTSSADSEIAICPNCKSAWDNAFNFCLKCSYTKN